MGYKSKEEMMEYFENEELEKLKKKNTMIKEAEIFIQECKKKEKRKAEISDIVIANKIGIPFISIKFHKECNPVARESIEGKAQEILELMRYDTLEMNLTKSEWMDKYYIRVED